MIKNIKLPLIKLPEEMDTVLFLIREELKSRKLDSLLRAAGFNDNSFVVHLDNLITRLLEIDIDTDEDLEKYETLMDKRAEKLTEECKTIDKQAIKAHRDLLQLKKTLEKAAA